jgi:hypothetical protein
MPSVIWPAILPACPEVPEGKHHRVPMPSCAHRLFVHKCTDDSANGFFKEMMRFQRSAAFFSE